MGHESRVWSLNMAQGYLAIAMGIQLQEDPGAQCKHVRVHLRKSLQRGGFHCLECAQATSNNLVVPIS